MARPRKFSDKQIIQALRESHGLIYIAAENLGCTPQAIYKRKKKCARITICIENQRGRLVDKAHSKLEDGIDRGEQWAVTLCLKSLGKDRGFGDETKLQLTGKDDGPMELRHSGNVTHGPAIAAADIALAQALVRAARATGDGAGDAGVPANGRAQSLDNGSDPHHN